MKEIARLLDLAPATISYHKGRLGFTKQRRCATRYDWDAVQAHYDEGHTRLQCQEHFGFCASSWSEAVLRGDIKARPFATPIDQLLVEDRPRNRNNIKLRLISAGIKAKRCEECGIDRWRGKPLSLSLHHVNGDGRDNRLENLMLLCPNCHSQTPNFGVKNWRRRSDCASPPEPQSSCRRAR